MGPETDSNSALVTEEPFPATSLDGRMSLGVPPDGVEQKSTASPPRAAKKDESFFVHPLGQL